MHDRSMLNDHPPLDRRASSSSRLVHVIGDETLVTAASSVLLIHKLNSSVHVVGSGSPYRAVLRAAPARRVRLASSLRRQESGRCQRRCAKKSELWRTRLQFLLSAHLLISAIARGIRYLERLREPLRLPQQPQRVYEIRVGPRHTPSSAFLRRLRAVRALSEARCPNNHGIKVADSGRNAPDSR